MPPVPDRAGNRLHSLASGEYSGRGLIFAVASGAIDSGIGYTLWYAALNGLWATRAAAVQLAVPVIAALGGVIFSQESITLRLLQSTGLILGGILLVVMARQRIANS